MTSEQDKAKTDSLIDNYAFDIAYMARGGARFSHRNALNFLRHYLSIAGPVTRASRDDGDTKSGTSIAVARVDEEWLAYQFFEKGKQYLPAPSPYVCKEFAKIVQHVLKHFPI